MLQQIRPEAGGAVTAGGVFRTVVRAKHTCRNVMTRVSRLLAEDVDLEMQRLVPHHAYRKTFESRRIESAGAQGRQIGNRHQ